MRYWTRQVLDRSRRVNGGLVATVGEYFDKDAERAFAVDQRSQLFFYPNAGKEAPVQMASDYLVASFAKENNILLASTCATETLDTIG